MTKPFENPSKKPVRSKALAKDLLVPIPQWIKLEKGHYQLDNNEYRVVKGQPDWSANDGRFPSTEWHLFDKDNKLIESGKSGESLKWRISYRYMSGKLGPTQPIVEREFKIKRRLDFVTQTWDHETTPEQLAKRQEWKDNMRDHALARKDEALLSVYMAFSQKTTEVMSAQHVVEDDGEEYIIQHYRVEEYLPYWQHAREKMRKKQGVFNDYMKKNNEYIFLSDD